MAKNTRGFFNREVVFGKLNFRKINGGKEREIEEGGRVMHKRINCRIKRKRM